MRSRAECNPTGKLAGGHAVQAFGTSLNAHRNFVPESSVLLVALLAMATVQMFRVGHSQWLPILAAEVAVFSVLPWVAYGILRFGFRTSPELLSTKTSIVCFQSGAILVGILVVFWHIAIRSFGNGDANELVALSAIQSVGWYLAVFSKVPGFEKASSILSGAMVFFVCCIADDWRVFLVAGFFSFVSLWWLLGQYWNQLESKAVDGNSRSLKLHGSAVFLTMLFVLLAACLVAAVPFTQNGISLVGFMPFSGGKKGSQDEFAISGIGDGNMLTGGSNATTTGAVESDEFIEGDKPSLYDITSERYEGPIVKKNRRNKAISLDAIAKHLHNAKQSEQAGRTFRTLRNSDETADVELENRITKALFFVEGSVPARFSINNFYQFDGWDWSSAPIESAQSRLKPPRIILGNQSGIPVFRIARSIARYLTGRRLHRVKIMRLDSKAIPAPALLQRWHIPLVDQLDMVHWGEAEVIEMNVESIPTNTIIDVQSLVPNYHLLRETSNLQHVPSFHGPNRSSTKEKNLGLLQVPANEAQANIQTLANEWTAGIEPGWMQVESIVDHLRNDFDLKPNWNTEEPFDDSVSLFLNQNGGPSYMFATSCAMVLRSAGYQTRLASGFLVQKQDYDSLARQSIVTADNLHMWPEVSLDGEFWIPVEPTPGYPIPYSTQTAWQWLTAKLVMLWYWLLRNPLTVASFIGSISLVVLFRAELITKLMFGWWFLVRVFWPNRLLKATRQLIDLRFWFSGDRRPASQTIDAWYTRVESNALISFFRIWNAKNYSENATPTSHQELVLSCRSAIDSLSLKRIRASRNSNSTRYSVNNESAIGKDDA